MIMKSKSPLQSAHHVVLSFNVTGGFLAGQKHRLARYTQSDSEHISHADIALQKPDLLRALIEPFETCLGLGFRRGL